MFREYFNEEDPAVAGEYVFRKTYVFERRSPATQTFRRAIAVLADNRALPSSASSLTVFGDETMFLTNGWGPLRGNVLT